MQLAQLCGAGYYSYSPASRQFGTKATIQALVDVSRQLSQRFPGLELGIGDLSLKAGGPLAPHQTHRQGRDVDLRPLRGDGKHLPVAIGQAAYGRERTRALVELLRAHPNVKKVLFNDGLIQGVTPCAGHHNHLHVSMKA